MKLRRLTIRNYRVHRDVHVDFDESRTLIGGPNESGKSTLIEALHRGFFLKAKGTTEYHRAMISSHGGEPEVEITFSAGGTSYHLKKRFGARGSTTLTPEGRPALLGDEAETALARLLNVAEPVGRKELPGQWSHLWVRQGFSGSDPAGEATAQQVPLLQRLQQMGGAVAVQSDLDASLAARFRDETEKMFRDDGKPKAGSDLAAAQAQADEAMTRLTAATERLGRLTTAIRDFEAANHEISTGEIQFASITEQKRQAEERLANVEALRRQETEQARTVKDVQTKLAELENADQRMARLRADFQTRSAKLAPLLETTGQLEETARKARLAAGQSLTTFDAAAEAVRSVRQQRDFLMAVSAYFEKQEDLRQLRVRWEKLQTLQDQLAALRQDLARLPQVDEKNLAKLRTLETKVSTSDAALNAMAADVEVVAADQPVSAAAQTLKAGESLVLTAETEIRIGSGVRLQIRPGGGSSLAQARAGHQAAQDELRFLLEKLGVAGTAEATEAAARRKETATRIETVEQSLHDAEGETLSRRVTEAQAALAAAEAESERRGQTVSGALRPESLEAARQQLAAADAALSTAEQGEAALKAVRDAEAQAAATAEDRLTAQKTATDQARREAGDLEIQLRTLEETHGDAEARSVKRAEWQGALTIAESTLSVTQKTLAELNADHVAADAVRLARALNATQQALTEATAHRAVAQNQLRSDGSEDPQTDFAIETARHETAQVRLSAALRKAEAIRLLDRLFTEEQRTLATRFTQPLADKISGYLECLFGAGARASVVFNDNEFQGLEFARPAQAGGAFRFETLSGGTKEQVAAAMRLAMAEILAAGFDGCLPVTFDDAFAYSDPDRVQTLQRMLDRAAAHGLQVIVLTCSPNDYATLGARKIALESKVER